MSEKTKRFTLRSDGEWINEPLVLVGGGIYAEKNLTAHCQAMRFGFLKYITLLFLQNRRVPSSL